MCCSSIANDGDSGNGLRTPDTTEGGNWVDTIALARAIGKKFPQSS